MCDLVEKTDMKNNHLRNWLAILGGLFWITWHLYYIFSGIDYREIGASILLAALSVFLMASSVYSLVRSQYLGTAGKTAAGFLLFCMILWFFGASLSGLNIWQSGWFLVIVGEALTTLGLAAFSLGALMDEPRMLWKWLPIFLAPIYFISFSTTSDSFPTWMPEYTPEWFAIAYGLGWMLFGFLLPRKVGASRA